MSRITARSLEVLFLLLSCVTTHEVSRESRVDFPEVSLQLLDPSKWMLAACGAVFREENIRVLEARSILCASGVRRVIFRLDAC